MTFPLVLVCSLGLVGKLPVSRGMPSLGISSHALWQSCSLAPNSTHKLLSAIFLPERDGQLLEGRGWVPLHRWDRQLPCNPMPAPSPSPGAQALWSASPTLRRRHPPAALPPRSSSRLAAWLRCSVGVEDGRLLAHSLHTGNHKMLR